LAHFLFERELGCQWSINICAKVRRLALIFRSELPKLSSCSSNISSKPEQPFLERFHKDAKASYDINAQWRCPATKEMLPHAAARHVERHGTSPASSASRLAQRPSGATALKLRLATSLAAP
jgi:hypothetical protein